MDSTSIGFLVLAISLFGFPIICLILYCLEDNNVLKPMNKDEVSKYYDPLVKPEERKKKK